VSRFVLLLCVISSSGCGSFLLPFDERPLPAPRSLETASGERIDLDREGRLIVRPERGDVGLALGVGLSEEEGGVVVTHRLLPGTALQPGDRILRVWARVPPAAAVAAAYRSSAQGALEGTRAEPLSSLRDALDERKVVQVSGAAFDRSVRNTVLSPTTADLAPVDSATIRARGHPVRQLGDLRGYASAGEWLTLDLLVERGGAEVALRARLRVRPQPLFVRPWSPSATRFQGVELVAVAELEPALRPLYALPEHLLVSRVARDAPSARGGLRPLDLVALEDVHSLLTGERVEVLKPDGSRREVRATPRSVPTEVWIPLLFTYQDDGVRTHVGLGPWDTTFHYSSRSDYEPTTDSYVSRWRWSLGTSVQNTGVSSTTGTVHSGGVSLLMDGVRMDYLLDLWNAEREARTRGAGVAQ